LPGIARFRIVPGGSILCPRAEYLVGADVDIANTCSIVRIEFDPGRSDDGIGRDVTRELETQQSLLPPIRVDEHRGALAKVGRGLVDVEVGVLHSGIGRPR